jgi:hypothetical protein
VDPQVRRRAGGRRIAALLAVASLAAAALSACAGIAPREEGPRWGVRMDAAAEQRQRSDAAETVQRRDAPQPPEARPPDAQQPTAQQPDAQQPEAPRADVPRPADPGRAVRSPASPPVEVPRIGADRGVSPDDRRLQDRERAARERVRSALDDQDRRTRDALAAPPAAPPRPVQNCGPTGCFDADGRFLPSQGPVLITPSGRPCLPGGVGC